MQTVIIVIHIMIVLALIGIVLIQRSEGGGLGIGGGSGFMSARGTANALTRTTAILAVLFFITSLTLGIMARYEGKATDILKDLPANSTNGVLDALPGADTTKAPQESQIPAVGDNSETAPATDAKPADAKPATETAPATDAKPADAKPATETAPATDQGTTNNTAQ